MIKDKVIRWSAYFLLGLFALWGLNMLITLYYGTKSAKDSTTFAHTEYEQKQKANSDKVFYSTFDSLINIKQFDKAIKISEERINIYPDDKPYLKLQVGDIYFRNGDLDSAISHYTEAINSTNMFVTAYVNRGRALLAKNEIDSAINDFEYAVKNNWDFYFDLGIAQERKGLYEQAKKSYSEYLNHYPNDTDCKSRLDSLIHKKQTNSQ